MMCTNTVNAVGETLSNLARVLEERKNATSAESYVSSLYAGGTEKIARKIAEESTELLLAAVKGDERELIHEAADLWFHTLVLLAYKGLGPGDVMAELESRDGRSGLEEKASRD